VNDARNGIRIYLVDIIIQLEVVGGGINVCFFMRGVGVMVISMGMRLRMMKRMKIST
jgi:hypothetical protein